MARRDEIRYVQYYTSGSAAYLLDKKPEQKKQTTEFIPSKPARQITIKLDPVAVLGTVVAVIMLVCVLIGVAQVNRVNEQIGLVETQLSGLKAEYSILESEYAHGYDLDEIRVAAMAMGMVPQEQVRHITVSASVPHPEEALSWWESLVSDIQELFA